tara:strand:- start:4451 stop:6163 length:1713 start_codon:yes stop_codon:yes gene_type:complete
MIQFQKIRWKNLLSTGDTFTEIDITTHKTNLIIGSNGAGKSTVLDAFTFGLFGKPFRKISKSQLVNSVNEKGTVVEVEFQIGQRRYHIKRGIKPNFFEIWENGKMLDQDSKVVDQQKTLEKQILKLNYKSFTQIVVLGSSTFVPFMRLPGAQRREIIEDLLDINVFSNMNEILKVRLKEIRDAVQVHELNAQSVKEKITLQEGFITQLESKQKSQLKNILDEQNKCVAKIAEANAMIADLNDEIAELNDPEKVKNQLCTVSQKLTSKKNKLNKDKGFYIKNDSCPTCRQSITEELKSDRIKELDEKIGEIETAFQDIDKRLTEIVSPLEKLRELSGEISKQIQITHTQNGTIKALTAQQKDLEASGSSIDVEATKLLEMQKDLKSVTLSLIDSKKSLDVHMTASLLLRDSGIKTRIIKKYLPVMNKLINQYLNKLQFYCNFTLDEEFKEVLKSRYIDEFSYENFSEGEKARIDISLLLTWRSIAKLKNSVDTNLLILDEIFDGSLDTVGSDELSFILRTFNDKSNVFVISHRDNLTDKFMRVLQFSKPQNFSHLEIKESGGPDSLITESD